MAENFHSEIKTRDLSWVVSNVLPINLLGQIAGGRFVEERSGVTIPYLRGKPGIAKTSMVATMCKENGWIFVPTHLAMKPLEELGGLPKFTDVTVQVNGKTINTTGTEWTVPSLCTMLYNISNEYPNTPIIWLLDDAHLWREEHQIMMFELMTYRKIKEHSIPDTVAIIMAGNTDNKAGARPLLSPVANRISHYYVDMSYEEWHKGFAIDHNFKLSSDNDMDKNELVQKMKQKFTKNLTIPKINFDKIKEIANGHLPIDHRVDTFLQEYTKYFAMDEEADKPFASPRTWTRLSNYITLYEKYFETKIPINVLSYVTEAHVGPEPTSDFIKYVEIFSKINIENDLKHADKFTLPENRVTQFAYSYLLGYTFSHDKNPSSKVNAYNKILQKFYDNASHEMLYSSLTQIVYGDNEVKRTAEEKDGYFHASMEVLNYAAENFNDFSELIDQ